MDAPYFQIETSSVHRDRAKLADWFPYEPHLMLWTARNRVRVMIEKGEVKSGHVRIAAVRPLDALVVDSLIE